MAMGRWIGGIIGWMAGGPLGALAGYLIGSLFDHGMAAEDGMNIFEFQGRNYKRSIGTVIDEGIVEGKFDDVDLDFVVSWAKRRGGACNILSKTDFEEWRKRGINKYE